MSLRSTLTRLFRSFTGRRLAPLSTRDVAADEIDRRNRVRQLNPIRAACRANALTTDERRRVYRAFEDMAPNVGLAEARTHACNLAASIASHRRARMNRSADPWDGHPPPAAA